MADREPTVPIQPVRRDCRGQRGSGRTGVPNACTRTVPGNDMSGDRDRDSGSASDAGGGGTQQPRLSSEQFARMTGYGVAQQVLPGDVVFRRGDASYDLIAVDSGSVEIVNPGTDDQGEAVLATYGPGDFLGELSLLTGQTVYLTARVVEAGQIHRIAPERFRHLMADDPEICDVLMRAFLARRDLLRVGPAARGIEIIGHLISAEALALRTYAARQRLPHVWLDADSPAGRALAGRMGLATADLPAVLVLDRVLRRATPGQLADVLGLSYRRAGNKPVDLTVVGSGPAGLAAAVYGASEGLDTLVLDAVGIGGQAAASSLIENYLGFPSGLSGQELTQKAALQAMKFGARLSSPCRVAALDTTGSHLRVDLADATGIDTRAVVVATGARYRSLPLRRWADFEGCGIYYAATELEARACGGEPVTVIGGANSAGQAALHLASGGSRVTVAVRRHDAAAEMSSYLLDRIVAHPGITVLVSTEVTEVTGGTALEAITLTDTVNGTSFEQPCRGLFCFIGAEPASTWLHGVAVDADGFIRTDVHLGPDADGPVWASLGRAPLPFETSLPSVFAAGDVRHGSMKRVAAAVGEGASAVRSVHAAIGMRL